ncbi:hypothetical protein YC2023_104774 [Brassica napus]
MILKYGGVLTHAGRKQGWAFGYPFGFGSGILDFRVFRYRGVEPVRYYSQISPLILLRYYDDAACVLRKMCLDAKDPHLSSTPPPTLPWKFYMLLDESTLPPTFIDSATHFTLEVL